MFFLLFEKSNWLIFDQLLKKYLFIILGNRKLHIKICKNRWCDSSFQKYGYNIVFERKLGGPNCNYIYTDLTECTELTEVNGRGCISVLRSKDKGCELSFLKYRYSIVFERYLGGAICNYVFHICVLSFHTLELWWVVFVFK